MADVRSLPTANGRVETSEQWHDIAYREADAAGDVTAMATVVLSQGGLRVAECHTVANEVMLGRLRRLRSHFDPMSSVGLRIRARLASEQDYRSGGHAGILQVLDEATAALDGPARASALSLAHHCLLGPGDPERAEARRTLANELIRQSAGARLRPELLMGLLWRTVDLFIDGDRHAERSLGELRTTPGIGEHPAIANAVRAIDVMLAIRAGNLDVAEEQARDCLKRGVASGDVDAYAIYLAQVCAIRWYQGRFAEMRPALADLVPSVRGRDLTDLPRSATWLATLYCVVEAACARDDAELCERVYALLSPYRRLPTIGGLGVLCLGSVEHTLGVAAMVAGQLDRAVEHLRAAVDDNLVLQHWPALVLSRFRYAQALIRRGVANDLRVAHEARTTGRQEAAALGLPPPEYADEQPGPRPVAGCARAGALWRIGYGRRSVLLPDSVGMAHLSVLLADPGRPVSALALAAGRSGSRAAKTGGDELVGDRAKDNERARLAVSKAIRRTIAAITRADPVVGTHLDEAVATGGWCCYRPV
jgi:hypothetical protein